MRVKGWCHEILSSFTFFSLAKKLRFLMSATTSSKAKLKIAAWFFFF
jgi:hypothetical protein